MLRFHCILLYSSGQSLWPDTLLKHFQEGLGGGWNSPSNVKIIFKALSALYKTVQSTEMSVFDHIWGNI